MPTRKQKTSSSHRRLFAAERLFYLSWLTMRFCQNYIKQKFKYILSSDTDKYKKYYLHRRYCDLALSLAEIDRININCKKLDKKILETETKIFCFCRQRKLLLRRLRELGNRKTRNIENVQKAEKKTKFHENAIPGPLYP